LVLRLSRAYANRSKLTPAPIFLIYGKAGTRTLDPGIMSAPLAT